MLSVMESFLGHSVHHNLCCLAAVQTQHDKEFWMWTWPLDSPDPNPVKYL